MFRWGRKTDGFDWHRHIRTTIKLRREDRRARIVEAGEVAVDGLRYAGRVGATVGSSGATSIWNATLTGIQVVIRMVTSGAQAMARDLRQSVNLSNFSLRGAFNAWNSRGRSSALAPVIGAAGLVALHAAFARTASGAPVPKPEQMIALIIALICSVAAIAPFAGSLVGAGRIEALRSWLPMRAPAALQMIAKSIPIEGRKAAIAATVGVLMLGAYLLSGVGLVTAGLSTFRPFSTPPLEGRAVVLGGDMIRVGTTTVRLSGIDAPEADQRCGGDGKKTWACGEAARNALTRLVKGRMVRCDLSGADDSGLPLGDCEAINGGTGQNLSAALVVEGAVFSTGSFLSNLSTLEADAKAKKAGIWRGESERPSDYRAKVWDAASKAAPDGCPIKGLVSGEFKNYVVPWARDYRSAKVRPTRGERWFCSEADAQAAGWKTGFR